MALLPVKNVAETARWAAAYRAWESARPDALFHDAHARALAGPRGEEIARTLGAAMGNRNGWPVVTRTKLLDDFVLASIADGCRCVLNLAAGLDTRPYRMALPPDLRWIEADVPEIIDEKERALAAETPACLLERVRIDLADGARRGELFARVDASASKVMVITEGLVHYLDPSTVAELGRDLLARGSFAYWALDFVSPAVLRRIRRSTRKELANAVMKFGPPNGVAFFEALGWQARDVRSTFHEAAHLRRLPWPQRLFAVFPPPDPRDVAHRPWAGVVRLARERG